MLSHGSRIVHWVALAGFASATACGSSRSTDFDQDASSRGGASGSDVGGASGAIGGSAQGGSSGADQGGTGVGGDTGGTGAGGSPSGGTSSGGTSSGGTSSGGTSSGGTSSGGTGGAGSSSGGSAGTPTAGAAGMGGAASGGSAGTGAGGTPTCNPNLDAIDFCMTDGAMCLCCPTGGATQACLCSTYCESDDDCEDPELPTCNIDERFTERGICTPDSFECRWGSR